MHGDRVRDRELGGCLRIYYIHFISCIGSQIVALVTTTSLLKNVNLLVRPRLSPLAAESISPICATVGSPTSMHAPDEEGKGTVGKASHYSGIGPVNESGIPIATRTVSRLYIHTCIPKLMLYRQTLIPPPPLHYGSIIILSYINISYECNLPRGSRRPLRSALLNWQTKVIYLISA